MPLTDSQTPSSITLSWLTRPGALISPRVTEAAYAGMIVLGSRLADDVPDQCGWPRASGVNSIDFPSGRAVDIPERSHAHHDIIKLKLYVAREVYFSNRHKYERSGHLHFKPMMYLISNDRHCLSWQQEMLPNPSAAASSPGVMHFGNTTSGKESSGCIRWC